MTADPLWDKVKCVACQRWASSRGTHRPKPVTDPTPAPLPAHCCPMCCKATGPDDVHTCSPSRRAASPVLVSREPRLLNAINEACAIIELGDQRLLAGDGPAGGHPPELSLAEWRKMYVTLDNARNGK